MNGTRLIKLLKGHHDSLENLITRRGLLKWCFRLWWFIYIYIITVVQTCTLRILVYVSGINQDSVNHSRDTERKASSASNQRAWCLYLTEKKLLELLKNPQERLAGVPSSWIHWNSCHFLVIYSFMEFFIHIKNILIRDWDTVEFRRISVSEV